ncbi:MAG: pesticidal protein Cry15Aa [Chloroflexi bacterium]|nr:pesticidal protein Cry15Aa [Chloroflexota bacterium]MDA0244566.1 pesticidal protein Cry15Aa [Chloroflexota bacterium]
MLVIKRYPNRKLYDTEAKQYITLDGISDLIREGTEVQVLDHATGEDLTTVILTQIIFEQEKKQSGFLPHSVLRGLVQAGGETLTSLRRTLASPLEMFSHVDEEIRRRVNTLVKAGDLEGEEAESLLDKLMAQGVRATEAAREAILPTREELSHKLAELGVPTKDDLSSLRAQLDSLEAALEEMAKSATHPSSTTNPTESDKVE